ncbi:HNH endonuclease [Micromonospora krabiensis]|uniref:HNH endonuclease n=1 Tax=Micromonospora krabiensis TaxID=307121 RepID=A0A1C3N4Q3_9ACTN|nr:HNH endonuclease [Micromonospora krabiensis]SBV27570.1 HNH endonuclease [Micromonospora krabiensis]
MATVTPPCSVVECDRPARARGWCLPHYKRWRRRGTIHDITPEHRFFSHVEEGENGCWLWTAGRYPAGYGKFSVDGSTELPHRWAYEFFIAEIPAGLSLDHLCRTPPCVNPWHLEPVTDRVNVVVRGTGPSARNARKTHCPQGHAYDTGNTYVSPRGDRGCRACRVAAERRHSLK